MVIENKSYNLNVLVIIFIFLFCPEPYMCKAGVGLFPVQSGGSLTIFPVPLAVGN